MTDQLNWRYATQKFDTAAKLSEEELMILMDAMRMAPSSYGLQPFEVLVITDPELREKLKEVSYGQPKVTDASHLIVFARIKNFAEQHIDEYAENLVKTRGIGLDMIKDLVAAMKGNILSKNAEELAAWSDKQAYISLGFLLYAAAEHHIDAGPMEGFDKAKYDEILGLADKNLSATVIAAVGKRAANDDFQHYKKVRKPEEEFFTTIK